MIQIMENKDFTSNQKICESCQKEFSCGVESEKCWCFEVEIKPQTLEELKKDFANCLCKDCLEEKNQTKKDKIINEIAGQNHLR